MEVCTASFPSSNARNSVHFDNVYQKLSTHAYSEVPFHFMFSKHENSKNIFL